VAERDTVPAYLDEARRQLADGRHNQAAARAAEALGLPTPTARGAAE
jgi:hypothetical protein